MPTKRTGDSIRRMNLKARYGISSDVFEAMLSGQNGKCKICAAPHTKEKPLVLDHSNRDALIRGLICSDCNLGLGWFRDSVEFLKRAILYLERAQKNGS